MNSIIFDPVNSEKQKRAPFDLAVTGFHIRNWVADGNSADPVFSFKVNNEERLVSLPTAPYCYPYYFDRMMLLKEGDLLEYTYQSPGGIATTPPSLVLEVTPISRVKKAKDGTPNAGRTMMKRFRFDPLQSTLNFELYPKFHTMVYSSFFFEDDNMPNRVIQYPTLASTNAFCLKYQVDTGKTIRCLDDSQMEYWRWGSFQKQAANRLPVLQRRRYWPPIHVRPNFVFFADRILPSVALTTGTNAIFEYEYLTTEDVARIKAKKGKK